MVMPNVYPALALAPQTASTIASMPESWLRSYYMGRDERLDDERRNYLREAGNLASQGNISGAVGAAFRGGDPTTAMNISNWGTNRRIQAVTMLREGAQRADTPERWAAFVGSVERVFGPEMVDQYRDFNSRPAAFTTLEQATIQLRQAEAERARAQAEAAMADQRRQQAVGEWLFGRGVPAPSGAPADAEPPPAAMPAQPGALGPVTPRRVQLLPVDPAADSALLPRPTIPRAAPSPAPTDPSWAGVPSANRQPLEDQPAGVPTAPPRVPLGGYGLPTPQPPPPAAVTPPQPQSQLPPPTRPRVPPTAQPQVRGWLGSEEQPDFQGTPMAGGVAPPSPQAPAAAPQPQQLSPPPQSANPYTGAIGALPRDQQRSAVMLFLAKDYAGLAKLMEGAEGAARTAAAQERGKALGQAQANLPQAAQAAASMVRNLDAIIDDPYLGYVTGVQSNSLNPLAWLPSTPWGHDTMERISQVQGQAFLQAYQSLRGGGQITEAEGAKAQAAIARLNNLGQSDTGYIEALNDARFEVWDLLNLARRKAGQQPVPYIPHRTDTRRITRISGDEDFARLPSGMPFIDPEGNVRTKP